MSLDFTRNYVDKNLQIFSYKFFFFSKLIWGKKNLSENIFTQIHFSQINLGKINLYENIFIQIF